MFMRREGLKSKVDQFFGIVNDSNDAYDDFRKRSKKSNGPGPGHYLASKSSFS
jgi:hypothetical protein